MPRSYSKTEQSCNRGLCILQSGPANRRCAPNVQSTAGLYCFAGRHAEFQRWARTRTRGRITLEAEQATYLRHRQVAVER
jgi:hypothetical protein